MAERNEVSTHEVMVYQALRGHPTRWMTNKEIAAGLSGIAGRTVRAHTQKLVEAGLVDQAELFPAHRYRWSEFADKRNPAYTRRLQRAAEILSTIAS